MVENELGWKRGWFVGRNEVLRFYQRSVWQIAVVGHQRDVGRERFTVLCRMLLMIFQRARGLDEEDWTSAAWNDFLAAALNLW